jgi:hypothetical protein
VIFSHGTRTSTTPHTHRQIPAAPKEDAGTARVDALASPLAARAGIGAGGGSRG